MADDLQDLKTNFFSVLASLYIWVEVIPANQRGEHTGTFILMPAYDELVGPQSSVIALLASGVTRLVSGEGKKGEEMGLSLLGFARCTIFMWLPLESFVRWSVAGPDCRGEKRVLSELLECEGIGAETREV